LLLFLVLLLVLELGARGPLLKQDVEGLLDVVGVELLVEVDDVFFLLRRLERGLGRLRDDHLGGLALLLLLLLLLLDHDALLEVVVLQVLVFELVLVEGVLVELGLLLVEVVVAHGSSAPRGACSREQTPLRLACRRVPGAVGAAEYNAAFPRCCTTGWACRAFPRASPRGGQTPPE